MVSDDAFLHTILAQPEETVPRLIYADWLEEHGNMARAELIRLQCAGQNELRQAQLLQQYANSWTDPIFQNVYQYRFHRGFIEEITVPARVFLEYGERFFAHAPIRLLRLIGAQGLMERLAQMPVLSRLQALHLTDCAVGDEGAQALAHSPHLANLQTLRLGANALNDRGVETLSDSSYLGELQTLVLRGNLIGDSGAQQLAAAKNLPNLRILDLSDNLIGNDGADALAHAPQLRRVIGLDLSSQFKGWSPGVSVDDRQNPIEPQRRIALIARFGQGVCVF
jgi:uncharacterized protein (TIGR02996 family)